MNNTIKSNGTHLVADAQCERALISTFYLVNSGKYRLDTNHMPHNTMTSKDHYMKFMQQPVYISNKTLAIQAGNQD